MSNLPPIRGLDLKIDPGVQKICEVYNTSSGITRSVLYFLLLINILALIAVVNSHEHNWTNERIDALRTDLDNMKAKQAKAKQKDSLKYSIELTEHVREFNIKNKIDRYQNVQVPILGNSFDINNLAIVCGVAFFVMIIILRFTLTREKNNLRIALESISERYIDDHLEQDLKDQAEYIEGDKNLVYKEISKTRRKHHYNFLSMNEVFNMPFLEVSDNSLQKTYLGKLVNRQLFYFPYFVYLAIFVNDLITIRSGFQTSFWHTLINLILSYIFLWFISYLCKDCNQQKVQIQSLFDSFFHNNYTYKRKEEQVSKDTFIIKLAYPVIPACLTAIKVWKFSYNKINFWSAKVGRT